MNIRKCLSVLLLAAVMLAGQAVTPAHAATVRYVIPGGVQTGNCDTWANGCLLTYALYQKAVSGDSLWVKEGTYAVPPFNSRSISFELQNGIAIYGGFAGTETSLGQRDLLTHVSILTGEILAAGNSDNSYHVVTGQGLNSTAVLDGFTISGGNADGADPDFSTGGGMYLFHASPTLTNITFKDNSATGGGGLSAENLSKPTLNRVKFENNSATGLGGGMLNQQSDSPLTITDSLFAGNSAAQGGGMFNGNFSSPTLNRVTFSTNSAGQGGGMMNDHGSNPSLTNVTFYNNNASDIGGAINDYNSKPTLLNVTVAGNSATNGGGGMHNAGDTVDPTASGSLATINDSIFWNNGTEITNVSPLGAAITTDAVIQGGCPVVLTVCNAFLVITDPLLGPLQNNGGFTPTMALLVGSSAIDTGGQHATCATVDQRGVSRPQGLYCDIGAFEYNIVTITGNAGTPFALITYTGGSTFANSNGDYGFTVTPPWTGTVTPSKIAPYTYAFLPDHRDYLNVAISVGGQNYVAAAAAGVYDDTSAALSYGGTWLAFAAPGAFNNTLHGAMAVGATSTFSFIGNRFILTYLRYAGLGNIAIFLDGSPLVTLSTNGATGLPTYTSPILPVGKHTVVVQHAGPSGTFVAIDSIEATTPVYAPGGTYDDGAPAWIYSGGWVGVATAGPYLNTLHLAVSSGSTARFYFTGTKFALTYVSYIGAGNIGVYVDENPVAQTTLNTNGLPGLVLYTSPVMTAGPHSVVFRHDGPSGTLVGIDKLVITP